MKNILIIDDSAAMRAIISAVLKDKGFDVTETVNGEEGLKKASENEYDMVITDLNMPNMDGFTVIQNLRTYAAYESIPVLVLTTELSPEKELQGKDCGATEWVTKPFNPEQLMQAVQKYI